MPSQSIEDYIKAIWSLSDGQDKSQAVSTNALAAHLSITSRIRNVQGWLKKILSNTFHIKVRR